MNKEHNNLINEYEICALCGTVTNVKDKLPADTRKYCIDSTGQLCVKSYYKIHEKQGQQ